VQPVAEKHVWPLMNADKTKLLIRVHLRLSAARGFFVTLRHHS
jgi:hypothetical protein